MRGAVLFAVLVDIVSVDNHRILAYKAVTIDLALK
jgi:hypothetical protein